MSSVSIKKKIRKNRITAVIVAVAFVLICVVLISQINETRKENAELQGRNERLEQQITEQMNRQEELEAEEIYVGTEEYIEEKAKTIGYVYPDEIVFKRED